MPVHPEFSRWLVLAITLIVLFILIGGVYAAVQGDMPHLSGAILGGSAAALATGLGTLPVIFSWQPHQRIHDALLGFGAGVMLAACAFSLIVPGLEAATELGASRWGASGTIGTGILLGAAALLLIDRMPPHEHFIKGVEGSRRRQLKRVWLFVIAIALHNVPEGLAIGVAFAGPDFESAGTGHWDFYAGYSRRTGGGVGDAPVGGYGRGLSAGVALFSGLVEPLMAMFGVLVVALSAVMLPWGLAAAAGAMLFVISHEIIPESHRQGHESWATGGLMIGFVIMMLLDTALG